MKTNNFKNDSFERRRSQTVIHLLIYEVSKIQNKKTKLTKTNCIQSLSSKYEYIVKFMKKKKLFHFFSHEI